MIRLIVSILVGALAGCIAGKIMETKENGFVVDAILGLAGSAIGGVIGMFLPFSNNWLMRILLSIIGACILIFALRKVFRH